MKKIAITGLSGVIGQILSEEISPKAQIIDLFRKTEYSGPARIQKHIHFDLLDKAKISTILKRVNPDIIVHMAAITHIDRCEKDKKQGKDGIVWKTNVEGTREIAQFCGKHKIPLIFLSTECVFDGKQKFFSENSKKNPINWYGTTKNEAEDVILSSGAPVTIIRSVVAYHINDNKKTIYGKILNELKSKNHVSAVNDQLFTPTHTYDIVKAINYVIDNKLLGIYHVAPKKSLTPYDFALLVADKNKYSRKFVSKITLQSYYDPKSAALRLRHACLSGTKSDKIFKFIPANPESVLY